MQKIILSKPRQLMKKVIKLLTTYLLSFLIFFLISLATLVASINADCGVVVNGLLVNLCRTPSGDVAGFLYCNSRGKGIGDPCCAGINAVSECSALMSSPPTPLPSPTGSSLNPFDAPRNEFFDKVDPLQLGGGDTIRTVQSSTYASLFRSPGGILSRLIVYIFPLAGLLLFIMLVWGGFEILINSPSQKSIESGKNRVTAAIAGFLLLFASYWIWQIIEVIFGIKIL